jgi:hypothetical protein
MKNGNQTAFPAFYSFLSKVWKQDFPSYLFTSTSVFVNVNTKYSESCLNWTVHKTESCLNWTLHKTESCLNWTLNKTEPSIKRNPV